MVKTCVITGYFVVLFLQLLINKMQHVTLPSRKRAWCEIFVYSNVWPTGNGVIDSALTRCEWFDSCRWQKQYSDGFSPSQYKVVGERNGARHYLRDLASPCSINYDNNITRHAIYGRTQCACKELFLKKPKQR